MVEEMEMTGRGPAEGPRRTWRETVQKDMEALGEEGYTVALG